MNWADREDKPTHPTASPADKLAFPLRSGGLGSLIDHRRTADGNWTTVSTPKVVDMADSDFAGCGGL